MLVPSPPLSLITATRSQRALAAGRSSRRGGASIGCQLVAGQQPGARAGLELLQAPREGRQRGGTGAVGAHAVQGGGHRPDGIG